MRTVLSIFKTRKRTMIFITGLFVSLLVGVSNANGANRYSVATGSWSATSTWSASSGGAAGASAPVDGDVVYIERGYTVTVNATATCASISFTNVPSASSTISISGSNTLTVTGLINMIRPGSGYVHTIAVGAGSLTAGSLTMAATTATRNNIISISTGTVTINGTVTTGTTGCQFNFTGAGLLKFGGTFSGGPAALAPSTGTVEYTSANPVIQAFSGSYYNIVFSGSGTTTGSASGTITIQSNLANTGGGTLNFSALSVIFSGTVLANSIAGFSTTGAVSMTKTAGTATFLGNVNGAGLTINGSGGTLNLGTGLTHIFNSTWKRTNGTLNGGSSLLKIRGSVNGTGGTFTAGTGTVEWNAASTQTVAGVTYYNLTISGSSIKTLGGAITVNHDLTVNNGTLADGGFQITGNATGLMSMAAGTTLTLGTTTAATAFPANYTGANISLSTTSTINYNSNLAQTISAVPVYGNLTLTATAVAGITKTAGGALIINGNLSIGTYNTLAGGANIITVKGNVVNNGTHTSSVAGKITLSGGIAAHAISGGASSFGNLELNDVLGATFTGTATTNITGTLTVTAGTLTVNSFTTALNVSGVTSISGILNFNSATGARTFTGLLTIQSGGSWNNSSYNAAITFGGGIANNGAFNAGTGLYSFTTNAQSLTGTLSIPNISVTSITLTNNGTLTCTAALSGTGGLTNAAAGILHIDFTGTVGITTLTATAVGNIVEYGFAGTQTVKAVAYYHLTLSNSGAKTFAVTTVNGNLTLSGSASATTGAALVIGGNLNVGNGTTFTAAGFNLTVNGTINVGAGTSGSFVISSATGTKLFTGLVTINAGGSWTNTSSNCPVGFRGGIINNGAFNSGTGVHTFNTNNQGLTGIFTIPNVTVTGITLTNNGTLTCNGALVGTGGLTNAATGYLHVDFTGAVGITTLTATFVGNIVDYGYAGTQTVKAGTYANLILSASGVKTFASATTVNANLSISGTAVANLGTHTSSANTLTLSDIGQPSGSWGGTGSGAAHINSTYFAAANGILNVSTSLCISWIGLTNTDWNTASNWCAGVPISSTNVIIPAGGNQPVIGADAVCNNITINSGASLTITGSNTLTVNGNWINSGTFTANTSTVIFSGTGPGNIGAGNFNNISFNGAGTKKAIGILTIAGDVTISNNFTAGAFTHSVGGSWSNTGTCTATGSTINFNGNSASNIGASNFNHITISGAGIKTATGTITVAGNFNLTSGALVFSNPISNSITISGNYTQTGGLFDFNTTVSGTSAMYLGGNLTQTSGAESMTTYGEGALNGVITFNGSAIQTMSFANPSGAIWVVYSVPAGKSVRLLSDVALNSANGVTQAGFQGEIRVNGTFDLGTSTVTQAGGVDGTAVFTVNSGANLITAHAGGISGSVSSTNMTNTFSSQANYEFNGASTGTFATTPMASTVNNLIIDNSLDVALTKSLTVVGQLLLTNGKLTVGAKTLTIAGSSPARINGTIDAGNAGATLAFTNSAAITLPASIFTGDVKNLTINGVGGVTASTDFTISGMLNLQSANPSATIGSLDMWDGTVMKTLTMGASSTTIGSGDVTGIVKRTSFAANTAYSFGNQFTTLTFASVLTSPTSIQVKIALDEVPFWKPDAIQRLYDIIHTGGSVTGVALKLHYLDNELNDNPEVDLCTWDYHAVTTPIVLEKHTRTDQSTINKWVSTSIPDISYFGTNYNEHPWTLAKTPDVTFAGSKGWRMISSPTLESSAALLTDFISQGVPGSNYPEKQPNFLWFDETDTLTTNMSWRTSIYNDNLVPGRGYYFYVFDSISQATPTSPIYSDKLPRPMTTSGNAYFPGSFSYSGTNHHVTFTPRVGGQVSQSPGDTIFYDSNVDDQGWNLMGNPTVSTLDWDAVGWTKTNLDSTIYIWDPAVNQYRVWNGIDGNLPLSDGLISPFQAFWVRANNPDPVLEFTSDALTTGGTFYGGASVKSAPVNPAPSAISLSLNSTGLESDIIVSFKDDGKVGPDPWDGYRLAPLSNSWMELFTLSSPSHTMPLVINNLPSDFPECINLPLYVGGQLNGRQIAGTYTLNWDLPPDWPSGWSITLNDHSEKKAISMWREHSYSFTAGNAKSAIADTIQDLNVPVLPPSMIDPLANESRLKSSTQLSPFSIVIQKGNSHDDPVYMAPEPALMQNFPNPFGQYTTIRFSLPTPAYVTLKIFDVHGILIDVVADRNFETGVYNLPWNCNNAKSGIYLLQMHAGDIIKIKKLVIII